MQGIETLDPTLSQGSGLTDADLDRATGASSKYIRTFSPCGSFIQTPNKRHPLSAKNSEEVLDNSARDATRHRPQACVKGLEESIQLQRDHTAGRGEGRDHTAPGRQKK